MMSLFKEYLIVAATLIVYATIGVLLALGV